MFIVTEYAALRTSSDKAGYFLNEVLVLFGWNKDWDTILGTFNKYM